MDATEALAAALQSVLYPGEDIDRDENLWIEQDTKRDAAAILAALDGYVLVPVGLVEEHPGEPHHFRAECTRCGKPGMVNVTILAPDEIAVIQTLAAVEETP